MWQCCVLFSILFVIYFSLNSQWIHDTHAVTDERTDIHAVTDGLTDTLVLTDRPTYTQWQTHTYVPILRSGNVTKCDCRLLCQCFCWHLCVGFCAVSGPCKCLCGQTLEYKITCFIIFHVREKADQIYFAKRRITRSL